MFSYSSYQLVFVSYLHSQQNYYVTQNLHFLYVLLETVFEQMVSKCSYVLFEPIDFNVLTDKPNLRESSHSILEIITTLVRL